MFTGYIYFIVDRKARAVKIGYSENPERRLTEIQATRRNKLTLFYKYPGTKRDELIFHKTYQKQGLGGEWFQIKGKLKEFIDRKIPKPYKDVVGFEKQELDSHFMPMADGDYKVLFGKHYNGTLRHLMIHESGYLDWLIWKSDFPEHIKLFVADRIYRQGDDTC